MRVLFLTLYPESMASPRYRVHQFLPYLRAQGVEATVACPFSEADFERTRVPAARGSARAYHVHEFRVRLAQLLRARTYDVVFLQKAVLSVYVRGMAGLLRRCSRRLIVDVDDAVHLEAPNALPARWRWIEDRSQALLLFRCANRVLAGNDWLRDAATAAGGRAETIPTAVDTERFVPSAAEDCRFVIGWIGGPSTSAHLAPIGEVLDTLSDAELRLIGADPERAGVKHASYRVWSYESEVREVQGFSVGLMPLPRSDWARGKCALKALQYMACGVPCVATPFGAVREIIEDGVNGFFAETAEDWRGALDRLRDPALRKRLGEAARRTVEERYSVKRIAPRLLAAIEAVAR